MFTQCPQCQTSFRVTAPMLQAAQGRVRCGRCGTVFNALSDFLQDEAAPPEIEAAAASEATEPDMAAAETAGTDADNSWDPEQSVILDDDELEEVFIEDPTSSVIIFNPRVPEPDTAEISAEIDTSPVDDIQAEEIEVEDIDSTAETAEHEILDIEIAPAEPEEAITLEGKSIHVVNDATGEYKADFALDDIDDESDELIIDTVSNQLTPDSTVTAELEAGSRPVGLKTESRNTPVQPLPDEDEEEEMSPEQLAALTGRFEKPRFTEKRSRALWWTGAVVFALALAAQIVHFSRQSLVSHPAIGPVLSRIYAHFGSDLHPAWDLQRYEVRQWGAVADTSGNGALRVRASLFNGAEHAQPFPVLRLILQDRFGGQVGSRDLEPKEYLSRAADATSAETPDALAQRLLGAGQRVDVEIAIVDPGRDAVGFEIDVCLRDEHKSLRCANDARRKPPSG